MEPAGHRFRILGSPVGLLHLELDDFNWVGKIQGEVLGSLGLISPFSRFLVGLTVLGTGADELVVNRHFILLIR